MTTATIDVKVEGHPEVRLFVDDVDEENTFSLGPYQVTWKGKPKDESE